MSPHQKDADMKVHLSQWEKSGLTQIAYCHEHGIKPHIFSYYKKKLKGADSPAHSSRLVPVKLISNPAPLSTLTSNADIIKLSHRNGFSLEVKTCTDLSSLKPLLDLLRSVG